MTICDKSAAAPGGRFLRGRARGVIDALRPPYIIAADTSFVCEGTVMGFKLDRVHVWAGEVADRAGGTAAKLKALAEADANLEFVYTQRLPSKPGTGILYVAPVTGPTQVRAARAAGLSETHDPVVLRIEGDNEAGLEIGRASCR